MQTGAKAIDRPDVVTRRLTMIVANLTTEGSFETYADLVDAVKQRCARLKIPWTNDTLERAVARVGSYRGLVQPARAPVVVDPPPSAPVCSPEDAAANRARLSKLAAGAVRGMPTPDDDAHEHRVRDQAKSINAAEYRRERRRRPMRDRLDAIFAGQS